MTLSSLEPHGVGGERLIEHHEHATCVLNRQTTGNYGAAGKAGGGKKTKPANLAAFADNTAAKSGHVDFQVAKLYSPT